MNKAHLTLIIFSVIPTVMTTNICQAKLQDEETQEFILVAENSEEGADERDSRSFSDYITLENVAKATVVFTVAGLTGGVGTNLALQAVGATAVPTMGTCVAVGASAGAGFAFGGGIAAMALKAVLAD